MKCVCRVENPEPIIRHSSCRVYSVAVSLLPRGHTAPHAALVCYVRCVKALWKTSTAKWRTLALTTCAAIASSTIEEAVTKWSAYGGGERGVP